MKKKELTEKELKKVVGGFKTARTKKRLRECPDMECDPGLEEEPEYTPTVEDVTPLPDPEHAVTMSPKMR